MSRGSRIELTWYALAAVYFASALPFFLAGTIVSLAISEAIERVDRAYFFDLAGAAAGCLLLIPFLDLFRRTQHRHRGGGAFTPSPRPSGSTWRAHRRRATAVLLSLLLVGLMVVNGNAASCSIFAFAKGHALPAEQFVAWNSFSRIGVHSQRRTWSIVTSTPTPPPASPVRLGQSHRRSRTLPAHPQRPRICPTLIRPGAKALIIGPGGG